MENTNEETKQNHVDLSNDSLQMSIIHPELKNNDIVLNLNDSDYKDISIQKETLTQISPKLTLTWSNLTVTSTKNKTLCFKKKKSEKILISDADGIARSNELLAIMGASGAGKTTLLNTLNMRNRRRLKVRGEIRLNGSLVNSLEDISSVSAYVQQDDLFFGHLTVREHLKFQAMLRMDKNKTNEDRLKRINQILHELNLEKCQDTLIGIFGKQGISGGEKRRLSFASEIITNPGLLFCDEPTSGLDSYMAASVIECLKGLAKKGKTLICTIHQPSSEIYEMFDQICLMAEGRIVFIGEPTTANTLFKELGYIKPPDYNPADFFIKKLAVLANEKDKCLNDIKRIDDHFEKSEYKQKLKNEINLVNSNNKWYDVNYSCHTEIYSPNIFIQMKWLLWRNFLGLKREPFILKIQLAQSIIIALMFGLIYLRLDYNQQGIQNINGLIFLCICNCGFSTLFFVVNTFPRELPIFLREYKNRMYCLFSYYISRFVADFPNLCILPTLFMSIVYWMGNLNYNIDRFFVCLIIINLVVQAAFAFGVFISAVSPNTNISLALSGPLIVPLMIFSGYLLNFDSIPKYFVWLRYLSLFSYAFETSMINQWKDVTNLQCETNSTSYCLQTGDEILTILKVNKDNFNLDFGLLILLIGFYRLLSYVFLWIRTMRV